jgi:putative transposase
LSVRRQCELLGLNRSTWYYQLAEESLENLRWMRMIDEQYLLRPYYGSRRMTTWLCQQGEAINRKRVQRLMRIMGLESICPKPRTTQRCPEHRVFPYLLRNVEIVRPDHVWSTDITYVPMPRGFMYLTAVMDWFSRYVLSWALSVTLDGQFCREALLQALRHGARPEIFNTDQGGQFTSSDYTSLLKQEGIQISMDGRGRALDNVFVERLWRTVKYEEVYLKDYTTAREARQGLGEYFTFYNHQRLHQALGYQTPAAVYY